MQLFYVLKENFANFILLYVFCLCICVLSSLSVLDDFIICTQLIRNMGFISFQSFYLPLQKPFKIFPILYQHINLPRIFGFLILQANQVIILLKYFNGQYQVNGNILLNIIHLPKKAIIHQ